MNYNNGRTRIASCRTVQLWGMLPLAGAAFATSIQLLADTPLAGLGSGASALQLCAGLGLTVFAAYLFFASFLPKTEPMGQQGAVTSSTSLSRSMKVSFMRQSGSSSQSQYKDLTMEAPCG